MHEEEVGGVGFLSFDLRDAGGHGDGADAGGADERIDGIFAAEEVHRFGGEDTAGGAASEGDDAEADDEKRLRAEEGFAGHGDADAGAEENGDDVDDFVLRGFDEAFGHAALAQEVAEHEHADERRGAGNEEDGGDGDEEGEDEFFRAGDFAEGTHADLAFLLAGEGAHDGRLDEGHERHVGVSGDGHGAEDLGGEFGGEENGGGSVGSADDADGGGLLGREAGEVGAEEGGEDADLRGGAEHEGARVGDERSEIGEGADAEEDEGREDLEFDALRDEVEKAAGDVVDAEGAGVEQGAVHAEDAGFLESVGQDAGGDDAFGGEVGQQGAEGDGDEEEGFEFLVDAEVKEHGADAPHDNHLPGDGGKRGQLEERDEVVRDVEEHGHRTLREA